MFENWKNNRTVQFAVGVTLMILVLRWLLTGDLLFATDAAMQPDDGETKSVSLLTTLWPMFVESMVIVGASAIAWACRLWDLAYGLLARGMDGDGSGGTGGNDLPAVDDGGEVVAEEASVLFREMARAAAVGDSQRVAYLQRRVRLPYALAELSQAYVTGNLQRAKDLTTELDAMVVVLEDDVMDGDSPAQQTQEASQ